MSITQAQLLRFKVLEYICHPFLSFLPSRKHSAVLIKDVFFLFFFTSE